MNPTLLLTVLTLSVCCHSDYHPDLDSSELFKDPITNCDANPPCLNRITMSDNEPSSDFQPAIRQSPEQEVIAEAMDSKAIKLKNSITRIRQNAEEDEPYHTEVLGHTYRAVPEVFSPKYFRSTAVLTKALPFLDNEHFLEIGTGIGVTAITAARDYHNKVVAVDINPAAVKVALENAAMHGVSIDIRDSDVFSALPDDQFDTIYWDLPYVYGDGDKEECSEMLYRAVCDQEYHSIETFLKEVRDHLNDKGRIFIGFGTNGDEERFNQLLKKYSFVKRLIHQEHFDIRGGMDYYLYQLIDDQPKGS